MSDDLPDDISSPHSEADLLARVFAIIGAVLGLGVMGMVVYAIGWMP